MSSIPFEGSPMDRLDYDQRMFAEAKRGPVIEKTDSPVTLPADAVASDDALVGAGPDWGEIQFAVAPRSGVMHRIIERSTE